MKKDATSNAILTEKYNQLINNITHKHLEQLTVALLSAYKSRDHRTLRKQGNLVGIADTVATSKLFAILIQLYHPDKLQIIINNIRSAYQKRDIAAIDNYVALYLTPPKQEKDYSLPYEEDYGLSDDDYIKFGLRIVDEDEIFQSAEEEAPLISQKMSFEEAVNARLCLGRNYHWNIMDLTRLEGELELQYLNINDLSGIELCINVTTMNLSGNKIIDLLPLETLTKLEALYLSENNLDNIEVLSHLIGLKELDLSHNKITSIQSLLHLPQLTYINLLNNPITDRASLELLQQQGCIIII